MKIKSNTLLIFAIVIATVNFQSCKPGTKKNTKITTPSVKFPVTFSSSVPTDIDSTSTDSVLVKFAWEHFLALNWQSSYSTMNEKRDTPDTNWNWSQSDASLAVWETYAHRSELRPYNDSMEPFDNPPHYSFGDPLYPINSGTSFSLFNNLDENNEIGSCYIYSHENIYGKGKDNLVLYQAKVNRDEYEYILNNFNDSTKLSYARDSGFINLPAGGDIVDGKVIDGAIEIKTAWRELFQEDSIKDFFTRNVIYYSKRNDSIFYHNRTFALIGMHIIRKTKQHPNFIFATWEHIGVEKDDMAYEIIIGNGVGKTVPNYKRLNPIPNLVKRANKSVHEQIKSKNKNSIWKNYRLVGVQGKPTNDKNCMSYFLSNYVIESDSALAHFHGSRLANPFNDSTNNSYQGKRITMGGCMGCHGTTQAKTDFSFLLDNFEKPILAPDLLDSSSVTKGKLERYIESLRTK